MLRSWTIALQAQRPEGFEPLLAELEAAGNLWSSSNPELQGPYTDHLPQFLGSSPSLHLLNSTILETLRFATDSWSMRNVEQDETTLGGFMLQKGDALICNTHTAHMDPSLYENPRGFIPTRFLYKEGSNGKEFQGWFGGGISMCGGEYI